MTELHMPIEGRPRSLSTPLPVHQQERPGDKVDLKMKAVAPAMTPHSPDLIPPLDAHKAEEEPRAAFPKDVKTQQLKEAEVKFASELRTDDSSPTTERAIAYEELALRQAELEVNEAAKAAGYAPVFPDRESIEMNGKHVLILPDKVIITGIDAFQTRAFIKELQAKAADEKSIYHKYKSLIDRLDSSAVIPLDSATVEDAKKTGEKIGAEFLTKLCGYPVTPATVTASSVQAAATGAKGKHGPPPPSTPWDKDALEGITDKARESFRSRIRYQVKEREHLQTYHRHLPPDHSPPHPPLKQKKEEKLDEGEEKKKKEEEGVGEHHDSPPVTPPPEEKPQVPKLKIEEID